MAAKGLNSSPQPDKMGGMKRTGPTREISRCGAISCGAGISETLKCFPGDLSDDEAIERCRAAFEKEPGAFDDFEVWCLARKIYQHSLDGDTRVRETPAGTASAETPVESGLTAPPGA